MKTMLHISTKQLVLTAALCLIGLGAHAQSNDCPCADSLITNMECDVVYHDTIFAPENCPIERDTNLWDRLPIKNPEETQAQWRGGEKIYCFKPPVDSLYTFYVDEVLRGDPDFWLLDGCSDTAHNKINNTQGYLTANFTNT